MSFKNDYKSALGSVSPDTEKMIADIYEKLDENAPTKIRVQQRKKPVWVYIGSACGAAACVALFAVAVFRIVPNFVSNDHNYAGPLLNNAENATGGNAQDIDGYDANADDASARSSNSYDVISYSSELSESNAPGETKHEDFDKYDWKINESTVLVVNDDISTADVISLNGYEYFRVNETVTVYRTHEGVHPIRTEDGRVFYVMSDRGVVLISDEEWEKVREINVFFVQADARSEIEELHIHLLEIIKTLSDEP